MVTQFNMQLSEMELEALRELARRQGRSMSGQVRALVRQECRREGVELREGHSPR